MTGRHKGCRSLGRATFAWLKDPYTEVWYCIDCHSYFDVEVPEVIDGPQAQDPA
jgi:hypothetical protein